MEGPRAAMLKELPMVERLANAVFRGYKHAPQTMFQEYPDLYHEDNLENIRIIADGGAPVANINFLPQTVAIGPALVPAATLGGVCTLPDYRGHGHSTALLEDCIRKMEQMGICVLHVSGDRHMYRAAGCLPAGLAYDFCLSPPAREESCVQILHTGEEQLDVIARLYAQEYGRYIRSRDRMEQLMNSRKYIDRPGVARHTSLVLREGAAAAYFVVRTDGDAGRIVEWAGDKKLVLSAAKQITERYSLKKLSGSVLNSDADALAFLRNCGVALSPRRQSGTIKIIDFPRFMEALRSYFAERCPLDIVNNMSFSCHDEMATFHLFGGQYTLAGKAVWNDLIFGGAPIGEETVEYEGDRQTFQRFLSAVFPLPFPDTGNLSCV